MNEIVVGDYIRTNDGRIAKVVNIKEQNKIYKYRAKFRDRTRYVSAEDIKDNKPNIINLVKEDDYVNGHLVVGVRGNYIVTEIGTYDGTIIYYNNEIEDIVTNEQIEKIMYRVEE